MSCLFDTHTHLNDDRFLPEELDTVWARCRQEQLGACTVVGYSQASSAKAVALARQWDSPGLRVWATVGISPHDAKDWTPDTRAWLKELASADEVVALGETGLDYHYELSPRAQQRAVFEAQLELAQTLGLPVIIHLRDADEDLLAMLQSRAGQVQAVLHCYTSTVETMLRAIELGCFISMAGIVTFKKSDQLREVARLVPSDRLLLETDCPYLAPHPLRGKRCEPWMVRYVAETVATAREMVVSELAQLTTDNALRFFQRDPQALVQVTP